MNIGTVGTQRANVEEIKKNQHTGQEVKAEATKETAAARGDAVDISEEGRQKSTALRADASGKALPDGEADSKRGSADEQVVSTVSVADLKKELQMKKTEVKSKQAKLDEATQGSANDPSKEAQLKKLKNQVTQLEKEASKIQTKVYSS